ncbi:MAG: hypothetical protein AAGD10_04200 [Myxococcota bacterium]
MSAPLVVVFFFFACEEGGVDLEPRADAGRQEPDLGTRPDMGTPSDAGTEPDGGTPLPLDPYCDDGNPCTRDRILGDGCRNDPLPDGAICEDQDYCTLGDSCQAGVCASGTQSYGPMAAMGQSHSFGTLYGSVMAVDEGRFIFVDSPNQGSRLEVVHIDGQVEPRSHYVDPDLSLFSNERLAWTALGLGYVAWIEDRFFDRDIVIARLDDDDQVVEESRLELPEGTPSVRSLVRAEDRIYLCANDFFAGAGLLRLDWTPGKPPRFAGSLALGERSCGEMATSSDGARLYFDTSSGARWMELAQEPPVVQPPLGGVATPHVLGERLYLHGRDEIRVLNEESRALIMTIPGRYDGISVSPLGIWTESTVNANGGTESRVGFIDPAVGPEPIDEVTIQFIQLNALSDPIRLTSDGRRLVHSFTKRVFELDGDRIKELSHPRLGSPPQILGRGGEIVAWSRFTSHLIDLSDPLRPRFSVGGPHGLDPAATLTDPPGSLWSDLNPPGIIEPNLIRLRSDARRIMRRSMTASGPTEEDGFELQAGDGLAGMWGDSIYRIEPQGAGRLEATLRRLRVPLNGPPLSLDSWALIPSEGINLGLVKPSLAIDVDPVARRAVVALGIIRSLEDQEGFLFDVDLQTGTIREIARLNEAPRALRVVGDRVAYVAGLDIVFFELDQGEVSRVDGFERFIEHALGFDGERLYVSEYRRILALPWAATSSSGASRIQLDAVPTSLSFTAQYGAAATANSITTLLPACEP